MGKDADYSFEVLDRDITHLKNELQVLSKLLRDGNGQPSIMQQISSINTEMVGLRNDLYELRDSIQYWRDSEANKESMSWQFKTAILVALMSSVTSLIINFVK
jgi:hypothetical protein